ncbi:hypothetical protein JOD54_003454 [Actinokineospora baliensis]|uniref:hypothetical protein n=1 Tax=Actinokineospora baliensis TaxID=547056 RepID=UPI0019584A55|nr:hypothetical protein [Actinokineospora baliensis]MBM7773250.1 hypothetical protein [Actinokineospora baliensis]
MPITAEALVTDLKPLRQRRGLGSPHVARQITDRVRQVFGLHGDDARVVAVLAEQLRELAEPLPHDLRQAVLIAYALTPHSRLPTLTDRIDLIAGELDRDSRTVIRRIDDGLLLIAQGALARHERLPEPPPADVQPWRTTTLSSTVVLDQATPQVYERWRILVTGQPLSAIDLEFSVPVGTDDSGLSPDNPHLDVLYGGTLTTHLRHSRSRLGYGLVLPRELAPGAEHEYHLRYTFADRATMSSFYLCTPRFPCSRFDLRVRFGPANTPAKAWRIDGVLPTEVDDHTAPREPLDLDPVGEAHLSFTNLKPHLSFGAAWTQDPLTADPDPLGPDGG